MYDTNINKENEKRKKQARKKYLGNGLALSLINANRGSELFSSYWRTYHCRDIVAVEGGKTRSSYCKNRWCMTCQSIRTAKLINGYREQLEQLEDCQFVTLTAPTVPAEYLRDRIVDFGNKWRKITKSAARKGVALRGIRKAECTVRPLGLYHYHYHLIVENRAAAEYILQRWLLLNPDADAAAQDVRPAILGQYMELFKYFTKLTTKVDEQGRNRSKPVLVDPKRLDVIFRALRGSRVYQPFGGIKAVSEEVEEVEGVDNGVDDGVYKWLWCDWYNEDGQEYSGYDPEDDNELNIL